MILPSFAPAICAAITKSSSLSDKNFPLTTLAVPVHPNTDNIIVMDDSKIIETGSHKDLLNESKVYKYLYELQFKSDA